MLGSRRCGRRSLSDAGALPPAFWAFLPWPRARVRAPSRAEPEPTAAPAPNPQPPPATETEAATTGKEWTAAAHGADPARRAPRPISPSRRAIRPSGAPGSAPSSTPCSRRRALAKAKVSAIVVEADSGKTLYAHDDKTPLNAASNVKIVTSAASLSLLGPEYRWRTTLSVVGPPGGPPLPAGGEVSGDLYLRGSGDPTLSTEDLAAMVERSRRRWACTRSAGHW